MCQPIEIFIHTLQRGLLSSDEELFSPVMTDRRPLSTIRSRIRSEPGLKDYWFIWPSEGGRKTCIDEFNRANIEMTLRFEDRGGL